MDIALTWIAELEGQADDLEVCIVTKDKIL